MSGLGKRMTITCTERSGETPDWKGVKVLNPACAGAVLPLVVCTRTTRILRKPDSPSAIQGTRRIKGFGTLLARAWWVAFRGRRGKGWIEFRFALSLSQWRYAGSSQR